MRFDIATLFPEMCETVVNSSIIGRGIKAGKLEVHCHQIRDYTTDKHRRTDLRLHGGGMGMLMTCQPIHDCWKAVCEQLGEKPYVIYLSPQGRVLTQAHAKELKEKKNIFLLCGHYEGVDQRVLDEIVDEEVSIGDYVLTGGELGALVLVDCIGRMVEGVLPSEECFTEESHWNGLLEYPQYTHPAEWNGRKIPEILLTGDHGKIAKWRHEMSLRNTLLKRPDLLEKAPLSQKDRWLLAQMKAEWETENGNGSKTARNDGETDNKQ